jgi:hypothetical protein
MDESRDDLALQAFLFIHANDFLHAVKVYDMGTPALLPFRRKECCGFLSPLKSIAKDVFEPATLGSSSKNTNRYTTTTPT